MQNGEHQGVSSPNWEVQPLRSIEGDVPLPFRMIGATPQQTSVQINVGDTILIAADGSVSNSHGSEIFRLERIAG